MASKAASIRKGLVQDPLCQKRLLAIADQPAVVELSERIAKVMPHVKVLYMSGYTDDALLQRGVLQSGTGNFLEKPFTPEALAKKVREVLETE